MKGQEAMNSSCHKEMSVRIADEKNKHSQLGLSSIRTEAQRSREISIRGDIQKLAA